MRPTPGIICGEFYIMVAHSQPIFWSPIGVDSAVAFTSDTVCSRQARRKGWEKAMSSQAVMVDVSCAVEVFLATALLHKEQPGRPDFTIQEIVSRAAKENISGEMRSGVNVHASQHCVANRAPNPAKHRMLFATGKHTRRLLLPGDEAHPERTGKIFPDAGELPERYLPLLEWANARFGSGGVATNNRQQDSAGENLLQSQEPKPAARGSNHFLSWRGWERNT